MTSYYFIADRLLDMVYVDVYIFAKWELAELLFDAVKLEEIVKKWSIQLDEMNYVFEYNFWEYFYSTWTIARREKNPAFENLYNCDNYSLDEKYDLDFNFFAFSEDEMSIIWEVYIDLVDPTNGEDEDETLEYLIHYIAEDIIYHALSFGDVEGAALLYYLFEFREMQDEVVYFYDLLQGQADNFHSSFQTDDAELPYLLVKNEFVGSPFFFFERTTDIQIFLSILSEGYVNCFFNENVTALDFEQLSNLFLKSFTESKCLDWSDNMVNAKKHWNSLNDDFTSGVQDHWHPLYNPTKYKTKQLSNKILKRNFSKDPIYPWEMDELYFDNRKKNYQTTLTDLAYFLSPDYQHLQRILKYQAIWLTNRLDLVDYLYKHSHWHAIRFSVYRHLDSWRVVRSIFTPRSKSFPFWSFKRLTFLAKRKKIE
jgi:hypothetical protein